MMATTRREECQARAWNRSQRTGMLTKEGDVVVPSLSCLGVAVLKVIVISDAEAWRGGKV